MKWAHVVFAVTVVVWLGTWSALGQESDPGVTEMNEAFGAEIWVDENLWDDADAGVAERLGWPEESRTERDASFRQYPKAATRVLGVRPFSLALYGREGNADRLSMIFANKGDIDALVQVDPSLSESRAKTERDRQVRDYPKLIVADASALAKKLTALLGEPEKDRFGQGRGAAERVMRWDWKGHAILLAAPKGEYVALRIVPIAAADGEGKDRLGDAELKAMLSSRVERRENGDVIITGIPMVNQGPKGYCVPATWERALRYLDIEADMYALAMAGSTDVGGGTSVRAMMAGVNDVVRAHGRRMSTSAGRVNVRSVAREIDAGLPIMWSMYVDDTVNRSVSERSRQRRTVTDWDAYAQTLEPWRKDARRIKTDRESGHVCMIIGYNEVTKEIAISDSWGPEFAERWITEEEADAISQGQFVTVVW